jgi:hypothetical protein
MINIEIYYKTGSKKITFNNIEDIIDHLYYELGYIKDQEVINLISASKKLFPMYDIYTENIILVNNEQLYNRLINNHFRPINKNMYEIIKINNKIKHINFLKNFNIDILNNTFLQNIYDNNPNTNEITNCIRPSFLPIFRYINPYYTKTELIYLALNIGIWKEDYNIDTICSSVSDNDINCKKLLEHQIFIKKNNADNYIKYYSFMGSSLFNNYLRSPSNYYRDINLEKHINNLKNILIKSPSWDKSYFFYRWINNDYFLKNIKVNDIWYENGFLSTTRQAFVNPNKNYFGYILMKIKVPKNIEGAGLAIEYYSHFSDEEEILFSPSKFKLLKTSNTNYYHPNPLIKNKIISKYEFEWVGHINKNLNINNFKKGIEYINYLDFTDRLSSNYLIDKLDIFYKKYKNKFYTKIGNADILLRLAKIEQGVYDEFFYLNLIKRDNDLIGKELYITWENYKTGEINLFIEISSIISVNYYNKFNPSFTKILDKYNYEDIIEFIKNIAYLFNINHIIIHPDYNKYSNIINIYNNNNTYYIKQLYISDCFYFNELLFYYICNSYMIKIECSNFTKYLFNNPNIKLIDGINSILYILNTDLNEFINDFYVKQKYLYDPFIDQIFKIAKKIIKKNINIINELNNIYKAKRQILSDNKLIDLYVLLTLSYYYLIPYLHSIIFDILDINFDNIIFELKLIDVLDNTNFDIKKIKKLKLIYNKKIKIKEIKYKLI